MIDYEFIAKKYDEIKSGNSLILLIKSKDYYRFDTKEFNTRYQDARAFEIRFQEETIIFIKDVRFMEDFNYKAVTREADRAFTTHNTDKAIELYEKMLLLKKPSIHVYARLGLLYLSKNNIYQALIYLKIATGFSINTAHNKYDFTELIDKVLKKQQEENDKDAKSFVRMSEDSFKNDLEEFNYDTRINEVITLMKFHNMSLEEACLALNISEEEKNIISLYLARDFYAQNNLEYGDKLLKIVEKFQVKSERVKKLMQEIRTNRLFYKNRVDENYKPIIR